MATVATQSVTTAGVTPTVVNASAGSDKFRPGSIIRITNGSASSITATVVTPGTFDGDLAISDRQIVIAAGADSYVRLTTAYRNSSDGLVEIQWSSETSVTFEVIK